MNTKYETPPVDTETPRQRFWRRAVSWFYVAVAVALVILTVLGFFDPMLGA
jgi:rhamnogalacturonyl hydrolase YesR